MTFCNIGRVCTGERIGYKKVKVVTLELGTSNLTFLSCLVVKTLVLKGMYALGHYTFHYTLSFTGVQLQCFDRNKWVPIFG